MDYPIRAIRLGSLDANEVIDRSSLGSFGLSVLILCGIVILVDGFDVQAITYAAPVLIQALGVERSMLGPVFSSGLVGTMLGALILSPLADRIGRKLVLCGCIVAFALCSLATTTATSISSLMFWRFIAGLGLGGATPIAVAFAAEFCPARIRPTAVMIVYCGFAVGAGGGGLIASQMIPALGWTSVFWLGGIVPLALLAAVVMLLPESIGDLARRGCSDRVAAMLKRVDPTVQVEANAPVQLAARETGFTVGRLFSDGRAVKTLVLWAMFFTNILTLYFMVSWFPTLANAAGLSLPDAVRASATIQVGSIIGTLTLAALVRRFDTFKVMGLGYVGGAVALILIALAGGGSVAYFTGVAFLAGFFVIGTQTGANAISSLVYPASMRSTGVGWALGIGRLGSVIGPSLGGLLVALNWSTESIFYAAAVPAVLAGVSAYTLSHLLRDTGAENTSALGRNA